MGRGVAVGDGIGVGVGIRVGVGVGTSAGRLVGGGTGTKVSGATGIIIPLTGATLSLVCTGSMTIATGAGIFGVPGGSAAFSDGVGGIVAALIVGAAGVGPDVSAG